MRLRRSWGCLTGSCRMDGVPCPPRKRGGSAEWSPAESGCGQRKTAGRLRKHSKETEWNGRMPRGAYPAGSLPAWPANCYKSVKLNPDGWKKRTFLIQLYESGLLFMAWQAADSNESGKETGELSWKTR